MKILLTFIFSLILISCEEVVSPNPNGPNGSWWTGGDDGGVYVFIKDDINTTDNIYQGTIYYEHDHSVWYKGKFSYNKSTALDYTNKSNYSGWDGERLYFKDHSYLKATGKIQP